MGAGGGRWTGRRVACQRPAMLWEIVGGARLPFAACSLDPFTFPHSFLSFKSFSISFLFPSFILILFFSATTLLNVSLHIFCLPRRLWPIFGPPTPEANKKRKSHNGRLLWNKRR